MSNTTAPQDSASANVFNTLIAPVMPLVQKTGESIAGDKEKYTLSFIPFVVNLLYAIINGIKSQRLLATYIATHPDAGEAHLVKASQSMYSEAFDRYAPHLLRPILYSLLKNLSFLGIPEIEALGTIWCVDGSLFPAIVSMEWAKYKKTANAVKLHLAFELNRMIPVEFLSTEGNGSEKAALKAMIKKGITYVMDRGYISFSLYAYITDTVAYFVTRIKENALYSVKQPLEVSIPFAWQHLFRNVQDEHIVFTNDKAQRTYRRISFVTMGEVFVLLTNRMDLTTGHVIMLYAYRWQVELFFRSYKRTLNGLHLYSQSPKGIEVQFILHLIAYVLLVAFKQRMALEKDELSTGKTECKGSLRNQETPREMMREGSDVRTTMDCSKEDTEGNGWGSSEKSVKEFPEGVRGLVSFLGKKLQRFWKLSIHWLTKLRNLLFRPLTHNVICILGD